jgi:hypothetical protein
MGKVYIVGPKAAFVCGGRCYKPGDEIDGDLFRKEGLDAGIKGGHLIEKGTEPAAPGEGGGEIGGGPKPLDDMTLTELRLHAAEKGIAVNGNKAEVLAAIKEAEAKAGEGGGTGNPEGGMSNNRQDKLISLASKHGIDLNLPLVQIEAALKAAGVEVGD